MRKVVVSSSLLVVFLLFLSVFANNTLSATIKVSNYGDGTCSVSNVTLAYNATSVGDTLVFPSSCSATWSSGLTVSKAITIRGNNSVLTAGTTLLNGFFFVSGFKDTTNTIRITGFTFNSMNSTGGRRAINIKDVTASRLRIDHNVFRFGYTQVEVAGAFGVIDNNLFYNGYNWLYLSAGSRTQADQSWSDLEAGTSNAMFVENNKFIIDQDWPGGSASGNGNGVDAYNGGKIVFRHNEFDFDNSPYLGNLTTIGFHGSAAAGCSDGYWQSGTDCRRSPSVVEVYWNTYHGPRIDFILTLRGGSGLVYNNTHTDRSGGTARIYMREEEYYEGSNWAILRNQWPAEDQVHNIFIWGNTIDGMVQSVSNIVVDEFNSRCTGTSSPYSCCSGKGTGTCNNGQAGAFITKDREFFLHAPCGSSDTLDGFGNACTQGKAVFTGVNGASSSYPTDGLRYQTLGTMIFKSDGPNAFYPYVPYTYPHPFRLIPSGLTVVGN